MKYKPSLKCSPAAAGSDRKASCNSFDALMTLYFAPLAKVMRSTSSTASNDNTTS
ncbi:hypothetical protein Pla100_11760 [Neorhodopirellula pilleata]|uniref:Uncharacterized protein n=1 Tax=Neorhodopirellula pilleata TaxID=2714738 RepID=A0A5C6AN60_9BACT|nr:hypothetical protein Pla100_11760 [Neorhodopirellula pilleata]